MINDDPDVAERLKTPWTACFALAVLVSALSLVLKVKAYINLARLRRVQFGIDVETEHRQYKRKHMERYNDATLDMKNRYYMALPGVLENLPMGVLGVHMHMPTHTHTRMCEMQ